MFFLRYWSVWNYNWYLGYELGLFPMNDILKYSLINTSILGGYMTYVYPKKLVINIKNKKIIIKNNLLKFIDLIFHQLPVISVFFLNNNNIHSYTNSLHFLPMPVWLFYLQMNQIDKNKIYGIDFHKLFQSSLFIGTFFLLARKRI